MGPLSKTDTLRPVTIVEEVAEGCVKIVDRKKSIMVLDTGKNVPPADIESLLALSQYIEMVVPIADDMKFISACDR